jgi:hypothetical protein
MRTGKAELSLPDLVKFLDEATYGVVQGKRVMQKGDMALPVTTVVNAIYANRPNLFCAKFTKVGPYISAAKSFQQLLPKEGEKGLLQDITDCFWSCYCPIQVYWCTVSSREKVVIADAKLGMEGLQEWRQQLSDRVAL